MLLFKPSLNNESKCLLRTAQNIDTNRFNELIYKYLHFF